MHHGFLPPHTRAVASRRADRLRDLGHATTDAAVTRQFTGIVARSQVDIPMMLRQILKAMGDDHPVRQTWAVMVKRVHDPWCGPCAWTVQMTDQRLFVVSLLRIGLGLPA